MAIIKRSRQRDAILTFLMRRSDHPTAEVIYENVRKEYPNISLGTVYRNLTLLAELGHIVRVPCRDGSEHFDARITPHYHFQCEKCGCVIDLMDFNAEAMQAIDMKAADNFQGKIHGHSLFFYGICPKCEKQKTDEKDIDMVG